MSEDQPGYRKLKVPGKNELRPNAAYGDDTRGPLKYVPTGVYMVQDFGGGKGKAPAAVKPPREATKPRARGAEGDNIVPGEPR